ncbi:MAG: NAD(P)H-quinone oxidoreductase [Chloracidobacterium sp.]|nr:NAD(P)H-quinone oxidoreductase [Chloracidobacterium sp.]
MKTIYIKEFGSPEDLELTETPDPILSNKNEVLVRVRAAGLNRADLLQVRGLYPPPAGYSPNIPGLEFAGEIAAIGDEVSDWQIGDRVFGITAGEAQAEYLTIDSSLLVRIPDSLSFTEAAAVPEAFITAHDAIFTRGSLEQGETLLIHAVGSGVGLAGLQLGKANGSMVIGTSRTTDKLERCAEYGLDHGISTADGIAFATQISEITDGKGVGVILDLVGGAYFPQNLASLAAKGRLILVGLTAGRTAEFDMGMALQKRLTITGTVLRGRSTAEKAEATHKFADEVVPLLANGTICPNLDRVFAVNDVIAAYKYLGSNESFGKVVLEF